MFSKKLDVNQDIKKARNLLKESSSKVNKIVEEQDILLNILNNVKEKR